MTEMWLQYCLNHYTDFYLSKDDFKMKENNCVEQCCILKVFSRCFPIHIALKPVIMQSIHD